MPNTPDMLWQRLAAGEPAAVDEALAHYGRLIWSLARRHTQGEAEAEDAVQDILLDLWKSAGRYDSRFGSPATFVATIARRRLIDRRRKSQRRLQPDALTDREGVAIDLPDPRANRAEANADAGIALEALEELSDREREAILLSTYQGMSHSQIAAQTNQPLGSVKTYIRRGLIRVRERLERRSGAHRRKEVAP